MGGWKGGGGSQNPKALTQFRFCAWVHFGGKSFLGERKSFWGGNDFKCFHAKGHGMVVPSLGFKQKHKGGGAG